MNCLQLCAYLLVVSIKNVQVRTIVLVLKAGQEVLASKVSYCTNYCTVGTYNILWTFLYRIYMKIFKILSDIFSIESMITEVIIVYLLV